MCLATKRTAIAVAWLVGGVLCPGCGRGPGRARPALPEAPRAELAARIAKAPRLRVENLGAPVRAARGGGIEWVPNPDGKTYDLLIRYYNTYWGPHTTVAIDLGTRKVSKHLRPHALYSRAAIGPDGKYYSTIATQLLTAHHNDLGETHVVNVRHNGAVPGWPEDWVLEMPCRVDRNGIKPLPGEVVVNKHRYSGFVNTDLDLILRSKRIRTLIMSGVTSNTCVESTARDGFMRDYYIVFLADCSATFDDELHNATLKRIDLLFGEVANAADVVGCWEKKKAI